MITNTISLNTSNLARQSQMEKDVQRVSNHTRRKRVQHKLSRQEIPLHQEFMYQSTENAVERFRASVDGTEIPTLQFRVFSDDEDIAHTFEKGTPPTAVEEELVRRTKVILESKWPSTQRTATIVSTMAPDIPSMWRNDLHMLAFDIAVVSDRRNILRGHSRPIAALACLILACRAQDLAPCLMLGRKAKYFGLHHNAAISASNILWRHRKEFQSVIEKHGLDLESLLERPIKTDACDRPFASAEREASKAVSREKAAKKREVKRGPRKIIPSPLRNVTSVSHVEQSG